MVQKFQEGLYGMEYSHLKHLKYWKTKVITEEQYVLMTDFKDFLTYCFHKLSDISGKPTRLQYDMADYLQQKKRNKRIILSYRGIGKSYITCIYAMWRLYRDPNERIMIVSATTKKARENSTFMKNLLSSIAAFKFLRPGGAKFDKRTSAESFVVAAADIEQSPSVKAVGLGGQLTGSRATRVIFDDIETPENSASITQRATVAQKVKEGTNVLKPSEDFPDREIIYLGTPQGFESFYFSKQDYEIKIWPARYPTREQHAKFFEPFLADILKDDLEKDPSLYEVGYGLFKNRAQRTDPSRYSEEALCSDVEEDIGPSDFDLQYMLYTYTGDMGKYKLKLKNLIVDDIDTDKAHGFYTWTNKQSNIIEELPVMGLFDDYFYRPAAKSENVYDFQGAVMHIDPAGKGSDEISYVITKSLNGYVFPIDTGGVPDYSTENLEALAEVAKKYKVNQIMVEDNFGDGMFRGLLEPILIKIYPVNMEGFKVTNQMSKELRILSILQPLIDTHKIIVNLQCVINDKNSTPTHLSTNKAIQYSLFYQMARITDVHNCLNHDDRLDIFASACQYWIDSVDIDVNKAIEAAEKANKDKMMMEHFGIDLNDSYNEYNGMSWGGGNH